MRDNHLLHRAVSAVDNSGVSRQVTGRQGKLVRSLSGPDPIFAYWSSRAPRLDSVAFRPFQRVDSQRSVTIEELDVE